MYTSPPPSHSLLVVRRLRRSPALSARTSRTFLFFLTLVVHRLLPAVFSLPRARLLRLLCDLFGNRILDSSRNNAVKTTVEKLYSTFEITWQKKKDKISFVE